VANLLGGAVTGTGGFGASTTVNNGTSSGTGITLDVGGVNNNGTWNLAALTQQGTGVLVFDVNNLGHDQINLTGDLTAGGDLAINTTDAYLNSLPIGTTFTLIKTGASGDSGYGAGPKFTLLTALPAHWAVYYNADDVILGLVPEPAPYLLIGGAIIALGLIRRRRSRVAA
jgi:hypothetical protein